MPENFTHKQGQYLEFNYNYTVMHGVAPAEADMRQFFGATPSTIHQIIVKLDEKGYISRIPRQSRSIELRVDPDELPRLLPPT